jgi:hypothetical protein
VSKTRIELYQGALKRLGKLVAGEPLDPVSAQAVDDLIDPMIANLNARGVIYIGDADDIPDEAFNPLRLRLAWEAAGDFSVPYEQIPDCQPAVTEAELRALSATPPGSDVVEFEDF